MSRPVATKTSATASRPSGQALAIAMATSIVAEVSVGVPFQSLAYPSRTPLSACSRTPLSSSLDRSAASACQRASDFGRDAPAVQSGPRQGEARADVEGFQGQMLDDDCGGFLDGTTSDDEIVSGVDRIAKMVEHLLVPSRPPPSQVRPMP